MIGNDFRFLFILGEIFRQLLLERCQSEFEHDRVEALEAIRSAVSYCDIGGVEVVCEL